MNLRRRNITIMAMFIALMAMIVSLYVPHHHHEESVCIGNYDCKSSKEHSHQDDCGGKESKDGSCVGGEYIDSRCSSTDDQSCFSVDSYDYVGDIAYILTNYKVCRNEKPNVSLSPEPTIAPALSFKALRSPPSC